MRVALGRVPGRTEVRWRLIGAVIINGGLWSALILTAKGCWF